MKGLECWLFWTNCWQDSPRPILTHRQCCCMHSAVCYCAVCCAAVCCSEQNTTPPPLQTRNMIYSTHVVLCTRCRILCILYADNLRHDGFAGALEVLGFVFLPRPARSVLVVFLSESNDIPHPISIHREIILRWMIHSRICYLGLIPRNPWGIENHPSGCLWIYLGLRKSVVASISNIWVPH